MVYEILKDIKKGLGISIGLMIGFSFLFLGFAFVEPTSSPSSDNYVSTSSKILNLLTGINTTVSNPPSSSLPSGSVDWSNCNYQSYVAVGNSNTISCSPGYVLVTTNCAGSAVHGSDSGSGYCQINGINSLFVYSSHASAPIAGSIKCCDLVS